MMKSHSLLTTLSLTELFRKKYKENLEIEIINL